jgi:sodium-dependent dicarboxylate transporter 2/3/5
MGFLNSLASVHLSFLGWMGLTAPFALALFFWVYLSCVKSLPKDKQSHLKIEVPEFRKLKPDQRIVMLLFSLCVFFWITPGLVSLIVGQETQLGLFLKQNLTSAIVGLFFASFLFIFPLYHKEKILQSHHASTVDWPSLLLFGAGLSLGGILFETGLAQTFADQLSIGESAFNSKLIFVLLIVCTIFFTELASNTASANIILPVMLTLGMPLNLSATTMAVIFALACNSAFMLPVATPPNVIIYGTKLVRKSFMAKTGLLFNLGAWLLLAIGFISFS